MSKITLTYKDADHDDTEMNAGFFKTNTVEFTNSVDLNHYLFAWEIDDEQIIKIAHDYRTVMV